MQAWTDIAPSEPIVDFVGLPAIATTLSDLHLALLEERSVEETHAEMERYLAWGEEVVTELMLRALRRAGPAEAPALMTALGDDWVVPEGRFDADEAPPKRRRKLLGKPVRDMERSIGKNAPEGAGPSLRELWAMAHQSS